MKKSFYITLICLLGIVCTKAQAQTPERYCKVYGSVIEVDDPARADFIVYEEETEAFAEVVLFETDNALYADREGLWFFAPNEGFARYRIYFADERYQAHFTVYFTDTESFAGCR